MHLAPYSVWCRLQWDFVESYFQDSPGAPVRGVCSCVVPPRRAASLERLAEPMPSAGMVRSSGIAALFWVPESPWVLVASKGQ